MSTAPQSRTASSTSQAAGTSAEERDRRKFPRHPGKAVVEIIREQDPLRQAVHVDLLDISLTGIGLITSQSLSAGERVRIRLRNDVQRFIKEVRGTIRWTCPTEEGRTRLGIELSIALTAIDMQVLRRAGVAVWV